MQLKVLALGGDGIGPEVVDAGLKVLECAAKSIDLVLDISEDLLHGAAWERYGTFIRDETLEKARASMPFWLVLSVVQSGSILLGMAALKSRMA